MIKKYLPLLLVLVSPLLAESPDKILEACDKIRNPDQSFKMTVEITGSGDKSVFEVMTKGKDRTLIKTLEPKRDKDRDLLMVDDNMWAYVPNLKRAVRVSLNQKLSGQAANGDISRMRWHSDYNAKVESENGKEWVLLLDGSRSGLTYDKVRAVVEKKTFRPLRAQYLSGSGKVLKEAKFDGYRPIAGAVRPTKIIIADAVRKDQKSVISIRSMAVTDLSDSLFQVDRFQSK